MTIDNLTVDQLLWALAGAKRECVYGADGKRENQYGDRIPCEFCDGKGQVYALPDSVRELCPCLRAYDGINHYLDATDGYRCCKVFLYEEGKESPDCQVCRGRIFTPSRSLEAWLEADDADEIFFSREDNGWRCYRFASPSGQGSTKAEAYYRALAAALQARGVKLGGRSGTAPLTFLKSRHATKGGA